MCSKCGKSQFGHRLRVRSSSPPEEGIFLLLRAARQTYLATSRSRWLLPISKELSVAVMALRRGTLPPLACDTAAELAVAAQEFFEEGDGSAGLCKLDALYFHLYYYDQLLGSKRLRPFQRPPDFFEACNSICERRSLKTVGPHLHMLREYFDAVTTMRSGVASAQEEFLLGAPETLLNDDLSRYFRARFIEGVLLWHQRDTLDNGLMDVVALERTGMSTEEAQARAGVEVDKRRTQKVAELATEKDGKKSNNKGMKYRKVAATGTGRLPPPCHTHLEQWRDAARDWSCTLYAYAVPSRRAIETLVALSRRGGMIEVGAGTGYWGKLLEEGGADIVTFDKDLCNNEYHGSVPPWTPRLRRGGVECLKGGRHANRRVLLLAYPPPDTEMATRCLEAFRGEVVAHVGEVYGDTGTRRFDARLWREFELRDTVPLPNFGNTAYRLTVWKRRARALQHRTLLPPQTLLPCANTACPNRKPGDSPKELFRCIYCRSDESVCCSAQCSVIARGRHKAVHMLQFTSFRDESHWEFSDFMYERLPTV